MEKMQPFDIALRRSVEAPVHKGNLFNMARGDTVRVIGKLTPDMVKHHYTCMRLRDIL